MPPDDKMRLNLIKGYPSDKGVIPSLDGLRAISISIVLVSHAGYESIVPGGLGVTIFFFLSRRHLESQGGLSNGNCWSFSTGYRPLSSCPAQQAGAQRLCALAHRATLVADGVSYQLPW
jgi:hypothetical protein